MTTKKYSKDNELNLQIGKVPPNDKNAEDAVIGFLLSNGQQIETALEYLTPETFYNQSNADIFSEMMELQKKYIEIDVLQVCRLLNKNNKLEEVGGVAHLSKLMNSVVYINLEDYCKLLVEKWILRNMISVCGNTIIDSYAQMDAFEVLNDHESKISKMGLIGSNNDTYSADVLCVQNLERLDFLRANKGEMTGITTGFTQIDRLTNGWQPSDLIILAARPSVGKTAFALNLVRNAAIKNTPCAFFSLEMNKGQLTDRLISCDSEVPLENIKRGKVTDIEYSKVLSSIDRISQMKIFINDTAALNIIQLRAQVRKLVSKEGVKLVVVDYLQLMTGIESKHGNREQEISTISRSLKILAKELNIPIIALSQMSRAIETRANKEPQLSDLRESGAIEQDADVVAFLYRDDFGLTESEKAEQPSNTGIVKFAKHRNGALEVLSFNTDLSIQKWIDKYDYETQLNNQQSRFIPIDYTGDNPF